MLTSNINSEIVLINNRAISFTPAFTCLDVSEIMEPSLLHVPPGYQLLKNFNPRLANTVCFTIPISNFNDLEEPGNIQHIVEFLPSMSMHITTNVDRYAGVYIHTNHMLCFVKTFSHFVYLNLKTFKSSEEFIYHIRNAFLINDLNMAEHTLFILGMVDKDSQLYNKAQTYVRSIQHIPLKLEDL